MKPTGPRSYRAARLASAVALLASPMGSAALPSPAAAPVREVQPLTLRPCRVPEVKEQVRCGTFHALENRAKPDGRRLALNVVVLPARTKTPGLPVFILAGGPGEAATKDASWLAASPLRQEHDIVLVDQRGTNDPHRLDCDIETSDDNVQKYLEPIFADLPFWAACARRLSEHADLTQYSTPVAATDVDEVRQALGYDRIDLMGGSYGSRHAMVYIKLFGEHVHAAFLSGLVPLEIKTPLHHPASAQRALDLMAADCAADRACAAAYPDIPGDLKLVLDRLATAPADVTVKNPKTGRMVKVKLTRDAFADGLRGMLYSAAEARKIPSVLKRARAGDFKDIAQRSVDFGFASRKGFNVPMGLSANCNEDTERVTDEELARETANTFPGPVLVVQKRAVCRIWPDGWLPADHFQPYRSDIPVVFLSGHYDPVTPPRWGEVARTHFPNSTHVVIRTGHSLGDETCPDRMALQLFRTGDPRAVDTSCTASYRLPRFEAVDAKGERG